MKRVLTYDIPKDFREQTIAAFLKSNGYSQRIIAAAKRREDGIFVNGSRAYVSYLLKPQDLLRITLRETACSKHIIPVPLPLTVVYEDEDLVIINKQADTPIHPAIHNYDNTLANALAYYYEKRNEAFVFRCINRLDRDTTGLLIIAKHQLSAAILSGEIKSRQIQREYLAIASGCLPEYGTIHAPIARKNDSLIERCVDFSSGEKAITHFRRLKYQDGYSLASIQLETGRTHQIRVHMKHLGYPLIGDFLYHPDFTQMKRQALHSHRLKFLHPITKKTMFFTAPLPEDMRWILPDEKNYISTNL